MNTYKVLSIDAWGNDEDGWDWNQWFHAGEIDIDINADDSTVLRAMHEGGWLRTADPALVRVVDDQYNLVIVAAGTGEPLFAIEYGSVE